MRSIIIGMLAETPVHPGAGRSTGFVDLPVARESITEYPVIVGSSLKGALKDRARDKWPGKRSENGEEAAQSEEVERAFGKQDGAGDLIVSDARLLLLPVRSLTGHYKWATCPNILERLSRDIHRSGFEKKLKIPKTDKKPENGTVLGEGSGKIFLEEREFKIVETADKSVIEAIDQLMPNRASAERLARQLIVLSDDDFKWFASYGLPISARNVLDENTKTSKNLWYEETLAQDSLFYNLLMERGNGSIDLVKILVDERPYLQVGGNETVGQGWFALRLVGE
ncbi:type III-B CRISPR module RAMP protein Cmr4 [Methanothrix harundinacea]|uniref:CRISPR-associated protein, Cmr4 family n=1 Tax=Methanothrix harundinacea (strain 6Ac) TaxID=1110509 RepID=G7WQS5_METH6|nr:type III-B CRISPR module RAMP protein Cmr4 [Methanothrix harundinacea]AET65068.1 CRISPR-associated protein, Cmr4 family [Methanothrix harundinacea 6Ac]